MLNKDIKINIINDYININGEKYNFNIKTKNIYIRNNIRLEKNIITIYDIENIKIIKEFKIDSIININGIKYLVDYISGSISFQTKMKYEVVLIEI